jgi:hypothetical protein
MVRELSQLMNKLLHNSSGSWRARIGSVGLLIAAILLLLAVQIQINFSQLLESKPSREAGTQYLIINRQLNNNNLNKPTLAEEEIEQLKKLPEVTSVGIVQPAYFKATLSINSSQFPFQTDASFESVPADFIDALPANWNWKEGDPYVPVIIPSLYLDLYNFQFALAQQLPQLSPEIIQLLQFNIGITGRGQTMYLKGKVVGLSDRIQSLIVPASFMQWANSRFTTGETRKPSRVIIKTGDASSPSLNQFLQKNQLQTDKEKTRFSQYRQLVNWIAGITGISGLLLLVFALLVLSLFIQLNITGRRDEIRLLLQLGTAPRQLSAFLLKKFFPPQAAMVIIACGLVAAMQWGLQVWLAKRSVTITPFLSSLTLATALLLLAAMWLINRLAIKRTMHS